MLSYRPEIDGLRAIAITSVVLFHAGGSAFTGGYVGVDIFFVISGFLITSIILKAQSEGGFSYRDFYARRARRILPALLFMVLTVTALAFAVLLPADLGDYGKMLIYTVLFGANFRLTAAPAYFDTTSQDNPLLHMWSLAVEEQFYLLWPTLLLALLALLTPKRLRLAVLVLALASLISSEILARSWPKTAFYQLYSRGWELMGGAMLAMGFVPKLKSRPLAEALSAGGLILMLAPVLLYDKETAFPGLAALPPVLGAALVIWAEGAFRTRIGDLLSLKPIVFIGLISYSLYLWHWPVFAFPSYVLMRETTLAESAGLIALAMALAIFSWQYVEKPFRRGRAVRPSLHSLSRAGYSAAALTGILMVCGLYAGTLTASAKRAAEASPVSPSIEGCRDEIRVKKGPIECDIGKSPHSEAPEVVLWGDSHAMAYAQAISSVVESGKAYMLLDCAPILSVREVARNGREIKKNCVIANEYAIAQIERLSPKLVILAARWTMFQGVPYGHESRATRYLIADRSEPRTIEHSQHVLGKYLTATIERLRRTGASVLLVGQVPEIKVTVKKCLAIAQSLGLDDGKCRSIAWPEVIERQKATNRLLSQAAMMAGARVFWPAPEFCDSLRCYAVRDGEVFYDDGDHLSKEGAMRLAPAFGAAIKAATSDVTESATN